MRVALLCNFPPGLLRPERRSLVSSPGEIARDAYMSVEGHLIRALAAQENLELHVLSFSRLLTRPEIFRLEAPSGPMTHVLPARPGTGMSVGWTPRIRTMRRYLHQNVQPDIVHGMRLLGGYGAMAVQSRLPHVVTLQEFFRDIDHPRAFALPFMLARYKEWRTIATATNLVAVSNHVRERISTIAKGRIFVLPNMVDESFFTTTPLTKIDGRVLYLGRIAPEKGLMDLLRAMEIVHEQNPSATLTVVGGPSGKAGEKYFQECASFAHSSLRSLDVNFRRWIPNRDLPAEIRGASCAVFSSTAPYETFCIAVAEAMAAGVVPVVYRFGPLPEHVIDGESGFIVPPHDIDMLATRIRYLLADPAEARRMGLAARRAAARYRKDLVGVQIHAMYRKIIEQ